MLVEMVVGWLRRRGWVCVPPADVALIGALPLIKVPPPYTPRGQG